MRSGSGSLHVIIGGLGRRASTEKRGNSSFSVLPLKSPFFSCGDCGDCGDCGVILDLN